MKKILFFAASASLLLLTGCSKEVAEALPETTSAQSSEIPLKPVRIHIEGLDDNWVNLDNTSGKMVVEYGDDWFRPQIYELDRDTGMEDIIYVGTATISFSGFYYIGDCRYTYIGIVTDMELGNNTGEPYYRCEYIDRAEANPSSFNVPVAIAHDGSYFDITITLNAADNEDAFDIYDY